MTITATDTAKWLTHSGASVGYETKVAPNDPRVDYKAGLELNVRLVPLDPDLVETYTRSMEAGDEFPFIILRAGKARGGRELIPLCGNHRLAAANRVGVDLDAIVVSCSDDVAFQIAFGDNSRHGKPPTDLERVRMAIRFMEQFGWKRARACRFTNCSANRVGVHQRAINFRKRMAAMGATVPETLTHSDMSRLDQVADDADLLEVVDIIVDYSVPFKRASTLVTALNATTAPTGPIINQFRVDEQARRDRRQRKPYGKLLELAMQIVDLPSPAEIVASMPDEVLTGDSVEVVAAQILRARRHMDETLVELRARMVEVPA